MFQTLTLQIARIAVALSLMQGSCMATSYEEQLAEAIRRSQMDEHRVNPLVEEAKSINETLESECSILINKTLFFHFEPGPLMEKVWKEYVGEGVENPTNDQLYNFITNALEEFSFQTANKKEKGLDPKSQEANKAYQYKRRTLFGTDPRQTFSKKVMDSLFSKLKDNLSDDHWLIQRLFKSGLNNFDRMQALINIVMEGIFIPRDTTFHDDQMINSFILAKVAQRYGSRYVQKTYLDKNGITPKLVRPSESLKHELLISPFASGVVLANRYKDIEGGMSEERVMKALYHMIWEDEVTRPNPIENPALQSFFKNVTKAIGSRKTIQEQLDVHNFILTVASLLGYHKSLALRTEGVTLGKIITDSYLCYLNGTGADLEMPIFRKAVEVVLSDAQLKDVMNDKDQLVQHYNTLYAMKDKKDEVFLKEAEERSAELNPRIEVERLAKTSMSTTAFLRTQAENKLKETSYFREQYGIQTQVPLTSEKARAYSIEDFKEEGRIKAWLPRFKYTLEQKKKTDDYRAAMRYMYMDTSRKSDVKQLFLLGFPGNMKEVFPGGQHEKICENLSKLYFEVTASEKVIPYMEEKKKEEPVVVAPPKEEKKPTGFEAKGHKLKAESTASEVIASAKQNEALGAILTGFEQEVVELLKLPITRRMMSITDTLKKKIWTEIQTTVKDAQSPMRAKDQAENFLKNSENRTKIKAAFLKVFKEQGEGKTAYREMLKEIISADKMDSIIADLQG